MAVSILPKADSDLSKASADLVGSSLLLNDTGRESETFNVFPKVSN